MFLFQHKIKLADTGFFIGFTDFHSHLLPGVDDGVKTLEEALKTLDYFSLLGIKKVILTPHVMNGMSDNWEHVIQSFNILCQQYHGEIEMSLGAEYMLDSGFEKRVEKGLQYLDNDRILVETSYLSPPNNLYEQLYNLSVVGNTPVIAHPERYLYMKQSDYHQLKNHDYLLQLNLLSLSGYYGKQVMKKAIYLLEQEMYDLIGTDLHNVKTFQMWIKKLKVTNSQLKKLTTIKLK
ncbi:MAG: CpsB/CapC family capsule biosynthesis tyrosine phosphatase [Bacteroidales bacterium]